MSRSRIRRCARIWRTRCAGSTRRPARHRGYERLLLLAQPPSLDAGEITDKGYLNQRRTLECRSADVARLYAEPADPAVISGADA